MVRKLFFVAILFISACADRRAYYAPNNINLHEFSYYTIADINFFAGCQMLRYEKEDEAITIKEQQLEGNVIGLWNGNILLDPSIAWRGDWNNDYARSVLLHEIGHSLGYDHVDDPCHVMHAYSNNCNSKPEAFEAFSKQMVDERGC